jgi:hypothetical protein
MDRRKQWSDLSPRQQRSVIAAGLVQVLLAAATMVNFVGPLAYFLFGRRP